MKTLKCIISSLILMSAVVLTGCSDNITSPTTLHKEDHSISRIGNWDMYSATITLDTNEAIWLNPKVTSLSWILTYNVSECNLLTKDFFISSSIIDRPRSLPCDWESYDDMMLPDLVIENKSGMKKTFDITMTGIRVN